MFLSTDSEANKRTGNGRPPRARESASVRPAPRFLAGLSVLKSGVSPRIFTARHSWMKYRNARIRCLFADTVYLTRMVKERRPCFINAARTQSRLPTGHAVVVACRYFDNTDVTRRSTVSNIWR